MEILWRKTLRFGALHFTMNGLHLNQNLDTPNLEKVMLWWINERLCQRSGCYDSKAFYCWMIGCKSKSWFPVYRFPVKSWTSKAVLSKPNIVPTFLIFGDRLISKAIARKSDGFFIRQKSAHCLALSLRHCFCWILFKLLNLLDGFL